MNEFVEKILDFLDEQEDTRENLLDISHRSIRKSSSAMAALHRGDDEEVASKKDEIRTDIDKLNDLIDSEDRKSVV